MSITVIIASGEQIMEGMSEIRSAAQDAERLHIDSMHNRLSMLYDAGAVKRLHTAPTRAQTLAEHVYGAQLIAVELAKLNVRTAFEECLALDVKNILLTLLYHDAPELETGDVPAPVKRFENIVKAYDQMEDAFYKEHGIDMPPLNQLEKDIVKVSDTLDLAVTMLREWMFGNHHPTVAAIFHKALEYALERDYVVGVEDIVHKLDEAWRSHDGSER